MVYRGGGWLGGGIWWGQGKQAEQPPSHPQAAVICAPRQRLAALSELRSVAPLCQPGSAARLIPAATAKSSGRFLC